MIRDGAACDLALHGDVTDPRTYLLRFYPKLKIPPLDRIAGDTYAPLVAEVNHGIWIARCSCRARMTARHPEAPGGVVWLAVPLVWCIRCRNRAVGGAWRRVVLPAERERIEALLMVRPDTATRNWSAVETVDDLARENHEHGIGGEE